MALSKSGVKSNMPAASKPTKSTPASTETKQVAAAPVKKVVASKKDVVAAEPSPVVIAVTPAPVVESVEVRSALQLLTSLEESIRQVATSTATQVRALLSTTHELSRALKRETKSHRVKKDPATMTAEERTVYDAKRANNAFLKPRLLTPELCDFMGRPANSRESQANVTKFISEYIKSHGCFDPSNKRNIVPDSKLAKLLHVTDKQNVSYMNLQSFLKVHFVKTVSA
jgi:chromatin remodeling complex protein RSC6